MENVLESKYKIEEITSHIEKGNIEIWFSAQNKLAAESMPYQIDYLCAYVHDFFEYEPKIRLFIFMYSDLKSMNKAFGRKLPHANCCFVPLFGPESLIASIKPKKNISSIRSILIHEYTHIVFSALTDNKEVAQYRQRIPLWIDEGISLYLDKDFRVNFVDIENKRLETVRKGANGYWPHLQNLFTYFNRLDQEQEFGEKGMLAYSFSYFCVRHLLDSVHPIIGKFEESICYTDRNRRFLQ